VTTDEPSPASSPPVPRRVGARVAAYRWLLGIGASVFAADQLTKAWIANNLVFGTYGENNGAIAVIPGFFYLVHVGNTGAAWSQFTGRSPMLAALAIATLVAIYCWRQALGLRDGATQVCFGLLCGGVLGNLTDRILHGHVVDFIDLHFGSYVYPTFNVADSGICVGIALYLIRTIRSGRN
jgi:signal peptidase II